MELHLQQQLKLVAQISYAKDSNTLNKQYKNEMREQNEQSHGLSDNQGILTAKSDICQDPFHADNGQYNLK